MSFKIITDSISGLVAADRLSDLGENVELYIPYGANFNGFLSEEKNIGSRLIELQYRHGTSESNDINNYQPRYKGHSAYMSTVSQYLKGLYSEGLIEVNKPKLVNSTKISNDFLYGEYYDDLARFISESNHKILFKQDQIILKDYDDYENTLVEYPDYIKLSKYIHPNSLHVLIENIVAKLNEDFIIQSKYHRILWMPIIWDSTIFKILNNPNSQSYNSKFYKPKNTKESMVLNLIGKLKIKKQITITYYDKEQFYISNNKIFINNIEFVDSSELLLSINLNNFNSYFLELGTIDKTIWNFNYYKLDREQLLKEFSQITFSDKELPFRVSYTTFENSLHLCVENGKSLSDDKTLFQFLVSNHYLSESSILNLSKPEKLSLPFSMPTINNEKLFNYKIDILNDMFPHSIKLSPLNFYQSSALNEQIAQGLSVTANIK